MARQGPETPRTIAAYTKACAPVGSVRCIAVACPVSRVLNIPLVKWGIEALEWIARRQGVALAIARQLSAGLNRS